jgi:hypothetical protein
MKIIKSIFRTWIFRKNPMKSPGYTPRSFRGNSTPSLFKHKKKQQWIFKKNFQDNILKGTPEN